MLDEETSYSRQTSKLAELVVCARHDKDRITEWQDAIDLLKIEELSNASTASPGGATLL